MYLGLDIGTSAVKAAVSDGQSILSSASAGLKTSSPRAGWSEQDPWDWWSAVLSAVSELGTRTDLSAVRCIGLSGQMHGAVLLDSDRQVIRPAILWNDSRATEECRLLREAEPDIGQVAGVLPLPGFTAPKIHWLARNEPDAYRRISHILLPKDFIGHCLHGELATDMSDAAGTLWLNQGERRWSTRVADASQTDLAWLPRLYHGHEVVGQVTGATSDLTGIPTGTPVVAGGGDAATGAISLGVTEPGRGFISLGTSGQLFVADRVYRPNPERYVHAFAHTVPDRWFQMAAMLNGARPLSWIAEQLGISAAEVVALAESCDSARIPIFLPYLTGERSPHGDPHIRAGFFGLEDSTDRAALCRAVVEAVAFTFADAVDSFGPGMDKLPELTAIGGGSRSDFLLGLIASITDKTIGRAAGADAGPAFGAARLAACGIGELTLDDLAARPAIADRFEPGPVPRLADRLSRYRALYKALKPLS